MNNCTESTVVTLVSELSICELKAAAMIDLIHATKGTIIRACDRKCCNRTMLLCKLAKNADSRKWPDDVAVCYEASRERAKGYSGYLENEWVDESVCCGTVDPWQVDFHFVLRLWCLCLLANVLCVRLRAKACLEWVWLTKVIV